MTEQKPLNFKQIVTVAAFYGYAYSVAVTVWNYFLVGNTFYNSARYGIATGVGIAGYTSTALFFSRGKEYIDDGTETDN